MAAARGTTVTRRYDYHLESFRLDFGPSFERKWYPFSHITHLLATWCGWDAARNFAFSISPTRVQWWCTLKYGNCWFYTNRWDGTSAFDASSSLWQSEWNLIGVCAHTAVSYVIALGPAVPWDFDCTRSWHFMSCSLTGAVSRFSPCHSNLYCRHGIGILNVPLVIVMNFVLTEFLSHIPKFCPTCIFFKLSFIGHQWHNEILSGNFCL